MTFKEEIHQHCLRLITERITLLQQKEQELAESIANETKSTAGDKYETARAMLHIEQEQLARQIAGLRTQLAVLQSVDASVQTTRIAPGSLALVNEDHYFLSTALGRLQVGGTTVFALSVQSPLGALLAGKTVGDRLTFNGKDLVVREVR